LPSHQKKKQEVNASSGWHAPLRPRQLRGKGTQHSHSRFCLQVRRPVSGGKPWQVVWEVKHLLPALVGSTSSLWMMLIRPPGSYTVERHKQVFLTREKGFERKSHMEQQDKIHATAVNPTWRWFS